MNFIYVVDDNYIPLVCVSIISILNNNNSKVCIFNVITSEEETVNKKMLKSIQNEKCIINFYSSKELISKIKCYSIKPWKGSYATYIKLLSFNLVNAETAWYVDADIICNGDIKLPVLEADKTLAGVLDSGHSDYNDVIGIGKNCNYFNAGLFYIDIEKWKVKNLEKVILNYMENSTQYLYADQDVINLAINNEIQVLDPSYNWLANFDIYGIKGSFRIYELTKKEYYTVEQVSNAKNNVIFYHCIGAMTGRPWEEGNHHPYKKIFNKYLKETPWNNYDYIFKSKRSTLFRIQYLLYKVLPLNLYSVIHSSMNKKYIKKRKNL